jgi:hypothetical protein
MLLLQKNMVADVHPGSSVFPRVISLAVRWAMVRSSSGPVAVRLIIPPPQSG